MKFSIVMILLIIIIYGSNYLVLGDAEHIISYVWTHLGFIPVDILLVAFILDEIIENIANKGVAKEDFVYKSSDFTDSLLNLLKEHRACSVT